MISIFIAEDKEESNLICKAAELRYALNDIIEQLRQLSKHSEPPEDIKDATEIYYHTLDLCRQIIVDTCIDQGVNDL